ncbi:hypothetical protein, partial [Rhizobium leguminosarum]|uniref:hypothetical protein n=1 Tax=Rhizobium leguminosarum TaxID=384 RepID=UPI001954DF5C
ADLPSTTLALLIKLHNRKLKSQAVIGHAKPPKVDVQLSGVSSLRRAFLRLVYGTSQQQPSMQTRSASLAEMTAPVPAGDGLKHYVRLACGGLGTHADPLEGNTRLGDIVERGWID